MSTYDLPVKEFAPHPEGQHEGEILEVVDDGERPSIYGPKSRFVIKVESHTAHRDDFEPFQLWVWCTKSGSAKAKLTSLRSQLLRRPLTDEERHHFDPSKELVGRHVSYIVAHTTNGERLFANLVSWKPVEDQRPATRPVPAPRPAPEDDGPPPFVDGDLPVRYVEADSNSDLPF